MVEGDILHVYHYLDCHIQWGDVLHSQNILHLFFPLQDSKNSQNNFIKLAMVRWLPLLLRASFVVLHHAYTILLQMIDATVYPYSFDIYIKFE